MGLLLAYIILLALPVAKDSCVRLIPARDFVDVENLLLVQKDTSCRLTFEQARADRIHGRNFVAYTAIEKPLNRKYNYWGYLPICNNGFNERTVILSLGYPNINAEVYLLNQRQRVRRMYSGYYFKYSGKDTVKNDNRTFVQLKLPPQEVTHIYFRIFRNTLTPDMYLSPRLYTTQGWEKQLQSNIVFQGVLQGFLIMFITFIFALFLMNRDKSFLYYSLYFLTLLLNLSVSENFLMGSFIIEELSPSIFVFVSLPYLGTGCFYPHFARNLLDTRRVAPQWDKSLRVFSQVNLGAYPLILFVIYGKWPYAYEVWMTCMFAAMVFATVVSIKVVLIRNITLAKYIILGLMCTNIGALLHFLSFKFEISRTEVFFFLETGVLLEAVLFLLALGHKFRIYEKENMRIRQEQLHMRAELNNYTLQKELDWVIAEVSKDFTDLFAFPAGGNGNTRGRVEAHTRKILGMGNRAMVFQTDSIQGNVHEHFQPHKIRESEGVHCNTFLKKVISAIDQNVSNPALNVDMLGRELGISRVHLHRKIKAITRWSPSELIRYVRLTRAVELLKNHDSNISEIALDVGFSNPSHFARCFHKQYGINPKEFIKHQSPDKAPRQTS